jgi:hypothetical protein
MKLARPLGLPTAAAVVALALAGCSSGPAAAASGSSTNAAPANSTAPNGPPAAGTAAQSTPQKAGATIQLGTGNIDALIADYDRRCKNEPRESLECEALRSLLVAEVKIGLLKIEKTGDQRATEEALGALDLLDEPEILIAALRVLGHFPATDNLAARVMPILLESPYVAVQSMAAHVLTANPDPEFESLGRLWADNHQSLRSESAYDEYPDLPDHYASIGFPKYPGAEWFSPADSDRSIGWSTKDDAAAVAKWYGDTLHAPLLDFEKWNEVSGQQALILTKFDQSKMTRLQALLERAMRGDQAAVAEIEKLQKEMDAGQKDIDAAIQRSVGPVHVPAAFARDARWIIAARKDERISRLVVVFPIPGIHRTVIKEVWDLSDYASAWPKAKPGSQVGSR